MSIERDLGMSKISEMDAMQNEEYTLAHYVPCETLYPYLFSLEAFASAPVVLAGPLCNRRYGRRRTERQLKECTLTILRNDMTRIRRILSVQATFRERDFYCNPESLSSVNKELGVSLIFHFSPIAIEIIFRF